MTTNKHKAMQFQADQYLATFQYRLAKIINQQNITRLYKITGLSRATLYLYMNGKSIPTLPKLALIAQECGVSLAWLFSGEQDESTPPITTQCNTLRLTVIDDAMAPTIPLQMDIEYQPVKPVQKKKRFSDGVYVLTNQQGFIVRRVQWVEAEDAYCVFGDNPHYPPQRVKEIAPIGKVTAIVQSL
jgi:transcriptional regulator with XRE-family HTH domain